MKLYKSAILFALLTGTSLSVGQNKKQEAEFRKVCSEIANAFAKRNISAVNKYINPKTGIYVITRPGAMDAFVNEKKLDMKDPIKPVYPYKDTSAVKKHLVSYGTAPKFDCGEMKWNTEGFIADSTTKYNRISEIMDFRAKNEGAKYSPEDIAKKEVVEKQMRKVVFTQIAKHHGLVFYVSLIKGKWYLSVVDTTVGLCAG